MLTSPWYSFGQKFHDLEIYGRPAPYPVVNERAVRATAGLILIAAVVAFMLSFFYHYSLALKIVIPLFLYDFTVRQFTGLTPLSPFGVLGTLVVMNQKPEWVGGTQKRYAWGMGLLLVLSMMIIVNVLNIRGLLPLSICMF
jgi:hypothetical protein